MIKLMSKNKLIKMYNNDYKHNFIVKGKKDGKLYEAKKDPLLPNCYDYICLYDGIDQYINDSRFFDNKLDYKEFDKVHLGFSDIAALKVVGCDHERGLESNIVNMGSDGEYEAYYCNNAIVGGHYKKVYSVDGWIEFYDDYKKTFQEFGKFDIYRAGDFGIVINKITD